MQFHRHRRNASQAAMSENDRQAVALASAGFGRAVLQAALTAARNLAPACGQRDAARALASSRANDNQMAIVDEKPLARRLLSNTTGSQVLKRDTRAGSNSETREPFARIIDTRALLPVFRMSAQFRLARKSIAQSGREERAAFASPFSAHPVAVVEVK